MDLNLDGYEELDRVALLELNGGYYGTQNVYVPDSYVREHAGENYKPTQGSTYGYTSSGGGRASDTPVERTATLVPTDDGYYKYLGGENDTELDIEQIRDINELNEYNQRMEELEEYYADKPEEQIDEAQRLLDESLTAAENQEGTEEHTLGDILNAQDLAAKIDEFYQNHTNPEQDDLFAKGMEKLQSEGRLEEFISQLKIYDNVDVQQVMTDAAKGSGMQTGNQPFEGMSVGDIYISRDIVDSNAQDHINLIGHEVIHSIQVIGAGSEEAYTDEYMRDYVEQGYLNNDQEVTAYNFALDSDSFMK
jgi:hypothetical protein